MKMLHVTIQTKYFEETVRFYQEIAGLAIQRDMRPMGRNMVFLADGKDDTKVEIIERPDADNAGNRFLSIGFLTEDVQKKREELAALGYEVTEMVQPSPGVQFFFVKDPAGVMVQFM